MYRRICDCGIALVISLGALLVLAACGESTPRVTHSSLPSPTISPTATVPPVSTIVPTTVPMPTATNVPTVAPGTSRPSTSPGATLPIETFGRNCGDVLVRGAETINGAPMECFWREYQRGCGPGAVVLRVTQSGTGPTTTREFTLTSSAGGCAIQIRQEQSPSRTTTFTCAGLTREADGALHFRTCGAEGDIVIASPKP